MGPKIYSRTPDFRGHVVEEYDNHAIVLSSKQQRLEINIVNKKMLNLVRT